MTTAPRQLSLFEMAESEPGPCIAPVPPRKPREATQASRPVKLYSAPRLRSRLAPLLGRPLGKLILTDNRSRILSATPDGLRLDVRIHRSFCLADDEILRAVAGFLTSGPGSASRRRHLAIIRLHFAEHTAQEPPRRRRLVLRPIGETIDLRELFASLNREYFASSIEALITWGRNGARRRRRRGGFSIRLGSYQETDRLIRIHPALDRPDVPRYVVESVVYHEMLHAAMPATLSRGRRRLHPPEFRRRERLFRHFVAAESWLEKNLERLVRGRPFKR